MDLPALDLMRGAWAIADAGAFQALGRFAASAVVDPREGFTASELVKASGARAGRFQAHGEGLGHDELEIHRGVALIPVQGYLTRRPYWRTDRACYEWIGRQVEHALEHPQVRAIALDVDTHGGQAAGLADLSDLIYEGRSRKPIAAFAAPFAYSAGYFIASAAGECHVVQDGGVGSIGVILTILDWSKYDERVGIEEINIVASQSPRKHPDPTTDEGRAQLQAEIDDRAQVFVEHVARNRGVSVETVLSDFGQGGTFVGHRSVEAGLCDGTTSLDDWIESQQSPRFFPFPSASADTKESQAMQTVNVSDITAEWLEANLPELFGQLSAAAQPASEAFEQLATALGEAATGERDRILAIFDALDGTGHASAFRELAAREDATDVDALRLFANAERESRQAELDARGEDEEALEDLDAAPTASTTEKPSKTRVSLALRMAKRLGIGGDE